jgi:hypothetical protein
MADQHEVSGFIKTAPICKGCGRQTRLPKSHALFARAVRCPSCDTITDVVIEVSKLELDRLREAASGCGA